MEEKRTVNLSSRFFGQKVMIRTYSAGVHFGELKDKIDQEGILLNARRVYSWEGACSLSQLSQEGSKSISKCKISIPVPEILLNRIIEVIPMSEFAYKQLSETTPWSI